MMFIAGGETFPDHLRGAVVAVGNFDGVHRGHQKLLAATAGEAEKRGVPWGVVTFEPHPRTFFRPDEPVFRLTPPDLKTKLIGALGAAFTLALSFDRDFAAMDADRFVRDVLVARLGAVHAITGYDFHFGKGRRGNPDTLRRLGREHGFGVSIVEQVTDDDGTAPFSSSLIRSSLRHGKVADAARTLGYRWTVGGTVVVGDQRGRNIGFPTINLLLDAGCEPAEGIYATRVHLENGDAHTGAAYIGRRPTFSTSTVFLEVFLFDFSGDLYDQTVYVEFFDYIRPDEAFTSTEALVKQMKTDCAAIRARMAEHDTAAPVAGHPVAALQAARKLW